jgi:hypothetical protein
MNTFILYRTFQVKLKTSSCLAKSQVPFMHWPSTQVPPASLSSPTTTNWLCSRVRSQVGGIRLRCSNMIFYYYLLDGITLGKPNLIQTPINLDRVMSENDLLTAWLPTAIYFLPTATFLVVYFGHTGAMCVQIPLLTRFQYILTGVHKNDSRFYNDCEPYEEVGRLNRRQEIDINSNRSLCLSVCV